MKFLIKSEIDINGRTFREKKLKVSFALEKESSEDKCTITHEAVFRISKICKPENKLKK